MKQSLQADQTGERADQFLCRSVEGLSRAAAQRLLEDGMATKEGTPLRKNDRLKEGDRILLVLPEKEELPLLPQDIPLDIVYEDEEVIAVNKPVGMVVHPAPGHLDGTLVNALLYHCKGALSKLGDPLRPGIVHRIDRNTSGLLLAAKTEEAHRSLAEQLKDHSLYREYEAVVVGKLKEDSGKIEAPIGRHPHERKKMSIQTEKGKPAVTHWTVLARYPGFTHVSCRLETGRTHQIRVHFASIGHPVLGDQEYGRKKPYPGLLGQCLHAKKLNFLHPKNGERMTLNCPLPDYFQKILRSLEH